MSQGQKDMRERLLVRQFLEHARIPFSVQGIRSVGKGSRGPDVKVTCRIGGKQVRIGVEVVEYQVDAKHKGGSHGRRIDELQRRIWRSLRPRLAHDPSIRECTGLMCFDLACPLEFKTPEAAEAIVEAIVDDLLKFIKDHVKTLQATTSTWFSRIGRRPRDPGAFDQYPHIKKYFTRLLLRRPLNLRGPLTWQYNNAACVGVVEDGVVSLINAKAGKLPQYNLRGTAQTWLLICAGVSVPSDSAGSRNDGQRALRSRQVRDAADHSGFDRVTFWERARNWNVRLA